MRFSIAGALLLAALPAAAQRLDTRRIDTTGSETSCRFEAAPELYLSYGRGAPGDFAMWQQRTPYGPDGSDAWFTVQFFRERGRRNSPFGVFVAPYFRVDSPLIEQTRRMRVEVDGRDLGIPPMLFPYPASEPDKDNEQEVFVTSRPRFPRAWMPQTWTFAPEVKAAASQRILLADRVELILIDGGGKELGRFNWDTHTLGNGPALLDRVKWSCTGSARK